MPVTELLTLTDFLKGRVSGELDGAPFQSVSIKASNHKRFVIKGFVDNNSGPVVKFSCPWGQLSDGQIYYMPFGGGWQETTENGIKLAGAKLKLGFELADGSDHTASFEVG
jgi:hypothetical protein